MGFPTFLLLLSAVIAGVSSSPVAPQVQKDDGPLSFNPGGPIITNLSTPVPMTINPGGPVIPTPAASPNNEVAKRDIPKFHSSQPYPSLKLVTMSDSLDASAPAATPSEGPGLVLIAPPPGKGCTSTLSESFSYPCSWDGTSTIYPSTTILYKQVNCHGCDSVKVQADYWFCPNQQVSYTAKALSASTYWSTLCAPSTAAARLIKLDAPATATANRLAADHTPNAIPNAAVTPPPRPTTLLDARLVDRPVGNTPHKNNNMDRAVAACPTTYVVQPEQSAGRTSTKYSKIMTTTLLLECSGCPLVVSTALIGYGQVGHFTTTTTLPVGTTTAYACH